MWGVLGQLAAAIAIALISWLEKQHAKSKTAITADRNGALLRRIGQRVREWEDRARGGRESDPGGT